MQQYKQRVRHCHTLCRTSAILGIRVILQCHLSNYPGTKLPHGSGLVETIGSVICVICRPIVDLGNNYSIVRINESFEVVAQSYA